MENLEGVKEPVRTLTADEIDALIRREVEVQAALQTDIAKIKGEIEKVEGELRRASYDAETKKSAAFAKAHAEASQRLEAARGRLKRKEDALAISTEVEVELREKRNAACDEEGWLEILAEMQTLIEKDASELDAHFEGGASPIRPLIPAIKGHLAKLGELHGRLRAYGLRHADPAAVFRQFLECRFLPVFRDRLFGYTPKIIEEFARPYSEILMGLKDRLVIERETSRRRVSSSDHRRVSSPAQSAAAGVQDIEVRATTPDGLAIAS